MDIVTIIAQVIGIAAMILTILSMQCRSNRNFFICQEFSGLLFMICFFMLNAWGGAFMNIFGIVRAEVLRHEKIAKSKLTLIGLLLLLGAMTVAMALISEEKWYLLLVVSIAQICGLCFMWSRNGKVIRTGQLCVVSPLWIIYNLLIPIPSIGGILTELINICSCLLALFRYRKIGFTER